MNIINPSVAIMDINKNPQKHIENIARTCYKSEDRITEDSHKRFISNLVSRKHWAMLEHYIFIYKVDEVFINSYMSYADKLNISLQYMKITNIDDRYLISFSARTLLDLYNIVNYSKSEQQDAIEEFKESTYKLMQQCVYDYDCYELFNNTESKNYCYLFEYITLDRLENEMSNEEYMVHGWRSVKFICDRGVSHEIVRHRDASHAQESTRYCNYSSDKNNKEITIINPFFFNYNSEESLERYKYLIWKKAMQDTENAYLYLIELGATPQEARSVLPNSLKTELVMTARNYEWMHFFELRCDTAAHPQMRELAIPLYKDFCNKSMVFNKYASVLNIGCD